MALFSYTYKLLKRFDMFHLAAYTSTALANTANTDIAALFDGILTIQNSHFILNQDMQLQLAAAMSVSLVRARLNSGTLRQINPSYVRPVSVATLPPTDPNVMDLRANPLTLSGREELQVEATSTQTGTEVFTALLALSPGPLQPAPRGNIIIARATSTTAAVANSWTQVAVTLETGLPVGEYAIVGGEYHATNAIAFRLTLDNQYWRPGFQGHATTGLRPHFAQLWGGLGEWGRFTNFSLPRFEVLNNSTDNSHTFYLHLIKTR